MNSDKQNVETETTDTTDGYLARILEERNRIERKRSAIERRESIDPPARSERYERPIVISGEEGIIEEGVEFKGTLLEDPPAGTEIDASSSFSSISLKSMTSDGKETGINSLTGMRYKDHVNAVSFKFSKREGESGGVETERDENENRISITTSKINSNRRRNTIQLRKSQIIEEDGTDRVLTVGKPYYDRCNNTLITSKYTILNFLPLTIVSQFRRLANAYFLGVGIIMWIGTKFPNLFVSSQPPITVLGPLFLFCSVSLLLEGIADKKRHKMDKETNSFPCIMLQNSKTFRNELNSESSFICKNAKERERLSDLVENETKNDKDNENDCDKDSKKLPYEDVTVPVSCPDNHSPEMTNTTVKFQWVQRQDIRQGNLVVVRNREMIPADIVLLASSGEKGCAYIETSSIDGETNLKLRTSAKSKYMETDGILKNNETIYDAIQRISSFTTLGNPNFDVEGKDSQYAQFNPSSCILTTEPPNPHVNTFTGKLSLPSNLSTINEVAGSTVGSSVTGGSSPTVDIPLDIENLLLRGAILRNTEWAIGVVCFTGTDNKVSQNSIEAPTKFSQLDIVTNKCVVFLMFLELALIIMLSTAARISNRPEKFNTRVWYAGIYRTPESKQPPAWPYLPNLPAPEWVQASQSWIQYALNYVTLLSYIVPISMYFTLECTNFFLLYLIYADIDMYDATTDTVAEPRSTIVTDLGQIQYIFSDKTGTLTQNVMRFKRCSIDGMMFGKPVEKARPSDETKKKKEKTSKASFHPVRQILVGQLNVSKDGTRIESKKGLTFDAELFLRVMSLCHTVVVEKDLDGCSEDDKVLDTVKDQIGPDGAPIGFAYQAESPDEGALVSAASKLFGFQVVSRDSSGIKLKCNHPTVFRDKNIISGLKSGVLDPRVVAADSLSGKIPSNECHASSATNINDLHSDDSIETWSVLAVNKFDSTRKRMSILLRSPAEFGNVAVLLCKGADSAMLDPEVCLQSKALVSSGTEFDEDDEYSELNLAKFLEIQMHLGEFASEGLRTLVLGVKFLTDDQCKEWLKTYKKAATALKDRDDKLKNAASLIENGLHIVGATAIEDKLQVGVPDTIATLEKAGIKLWVLTGDKRETAIEIGYSTRVLTPQMHLTEVIDRGADYVRAQCAMEFMRLVKAGKLPLYQRAIVDKPEETGLVKLWIDKTLYNLGKGIRSFYQFLISRILQLNIFVRGVFGCQRQVQEKRLENLKYDRVERKETPDDHKRRKNVRDRAENIIKRHMQMNPASNTNETELSTDGLPPVFNLAQSARQVLELRRSYGRLSAIDRRSSRLSLLATQEKIEKQENPAINDDVLSLNSFYRSSEEDVTDFDKKKRTLLERMFAVDQDVQKGRLVKHLKKEKRCQLRESGPSSQSIIPSSKGPRALIIEGAALQHLQGDIALEEMIFNIGCQCDAVIACRVTPRQKAKLVKLVRQHISPEPVTLAIGDGANDVGMIHEAHVGIGISGLEGQQAVNASDFSISQFRFLESLIFKHGRWSYMRISKVILYNFYRNLILAGCQILFNFSNLFSGQSVFPTWMQSFFAFWAFVPILFHGMFDRCLETSYVRRNPEVYKATMQKEMITPRVIARWIFMSISHLMIIYYGQMYTICGGGGSTSAFLGLMWNKKAVGDGEVNDLYSMGTTVFTSMMLLLGYKVMYENYSIINGRWPGIICCLKNAKDGFFSRLAYTWWGLIVGEYIFYLASIYILSALGASGVLRSASIFELLRLPSHVLGTSSMNYVLMIFIPIAGMAYDVAGKVFSNMFYPSQTQIHIELQSQETGKVQKGKESEETLFIHPNAPPSSQKTSPVKESRVPGPSSATSETTVPSTSKLTASSEPDPPLPPKITTDKQLPHTSSSNFNQIDNNEPQGSEQKPRGSEEPPQEWREPDNEIVDGDSSADSAPVARSVENIPAESGYVSGTRKTQETSSGVRDQIRNLEDQGLQTEVKGSRRMLTPRVVTDVKESWDKEGNITRELTHYIEEPDGTKRQEKATVYIAADEADAVTKTGQ